MSIFLSPSSERTFCFLLEKSKNDDGDQSREEERIKIYVSKEFLAIASPVFKAMFYGEFREAKAEESIDLPGKTDEDFLKFLDCLFLYPTVKDIDESNVEAVLRLSDEYQVEALINKCDQYYQKVIKSLIVGDTKVFDYLPILLKYKLSKSLNVLVPYVAVLDGETIGQRRLQDNLKLHGVNRFYAAVYEAKFRRTLHQAHEWAPYQTDIYQCKKCDFCLMKRNTKCEKFHTCTTNSSDCICGYDFEQVNLN